MHQRAINPTTWLDHFGLSHAIEVTGTQRTLFLSGQASTADDGSALHAGDMVAQFGEAWRNLKKVLDGGDMAPANIVRLNIYTTDVASFMEKADQIVAIWAADGIKPACTLLEVSALFHPDLMVELEATAVA